jgi:hypothetical protein
MHADFKELLSLRDGVPTGAEVGVHVNGCAQCGLELSRLRKLQDELRQLPQFAAPPHAWPAIREELDRLPIRRPSRHWLSVSAGAALGIAVVLALLVQLHQDHVRPAADGDIASSGPDNNVTIGSLIARSQQLEAMLQRLPRRPSVERAATCAALDELQTRIQVMDLQIATVATSDRDRNQAQRLWSTRVQLLSSLVSMRYAEAVRDNYESANPPDSGVI